ncbi:MAG: glycosyltransferase [Candidatus Shapirobacteria bacterium]
MTALKINIHFDFVDGPFGGGNQFLKSLRLELINLGYYTDNPKTADIVLFNSFPFAHPIKDLFFLKSILNKGTTLIHRIDGPIFRIRGSQLYIDKFIYKINQLFSHGTIFQSHWSQQANLKQGMKFNIPKTIILNAPDSQTFYYKKTKLSSPVKIIIASWSSNINKGFETYQWLDTHLDFSKYQVTFVGNSPIDFVNIKRIQPLDSQHLEKLVHQHHIYLTASKNDPCSNSLIEALHCGLPAIALNDGGHPEIVQKKGLLFSRPEEIPKLLDTIVNHYEQYNQPTSLPDIHKVALQYVEFATQIQQQKTQRSVTYLQLLHIIFKIITIQR